MSRKHGALDRLAQHDPVAPSGRSGAEAVAANRPADRVVDRDETVSELIEFLGDPVDVSLPESSSSQLVSVAALVVDVPAWERS